MADLIEKSEVRKAVVRNLGLDGLSEEYQNQILKGLEETIANRLLIFVFEKLSEEDRKEFESKSALAVGDEAKKYLKEKIPDFEKEALLVSEQVIAE